MPRSGSRQRSAAWSTSVDEEAPEVVVGRVAALVPAPGEVDQLAVGVELELPGRAVADAHRADAAPALELGQLLLADAARAVHAVEDLQVLGGAGARALDEAPERVGLGRRSRPRPARAWRTSSRGSSSSGSPTCGPCRLSGSEVVGGGGHAAGAARWSAHAARARCAGRPGSSLLMRVAQRRQLASVSFELLVAALRRSRAARRRAPPAPRRAARARLRSPGPRPCSGPRARGGRLSSSSTSDQITIASSPPVADHVSGEWRRTHGATVP